jgi:zinc protease
VALSCLFSLVGRIGCFGEFGWFVVAGFCGLIAFSGCMHPVGGRRYAARPTSAVKHQGAQMEPLRFTLDNGLKVIIEENHVAKVVALEAWVDVGSASEPIELAGIAHVFEHMLFKGTERRSVGEIARDVEGAGGEINAWTSFDETVYHLVLPSRHFEHGLDILADVLQHSAFDAAELDRELKVVLEELKQGEDSPGRVASQLLFATAYQRHPYRRPVIGSAKTVQAMTRVRLLEFFRSHYVARNMTLVLCGDVDEKTARRKVEQLFGRMPAGHAKKRDLPTEPAQKATRAKVSTAEVRESHLQLGFHVPSVRHDDAPALEVLALILGHGEASRLDTVLRRERQCVNEVFAYAYAPRDPGLFVLGATTRPDELEGALDGLLDEILRLGREPVTDEELARALATLEADAVYAKETVQGRARKLGYFETMGLGAAGEAMYLRTAAALTPRELMAVARRYFVPENLSIVAVTPRASAPTAEQLSGRVAPALARATPAPTPRVAGRGIVETRLPSGARLLVLPQGGAGVVAIRAVFLGGQRYEDLRRAGISNLVAQLLTRGTRTRSGDEIARQVEGMAGALGGFSGRNTLGVAGEFLARDTERGLELLADCILHPSFREVEVERERRRVLEQLRTENDHPSVVAYRAFHEALYPKHPYRLPLLGEARSVATLTRRHLMDWQQRYLQPERMVLAVVGEVDPAQITEVATRLFPAPSGRSIEVPAPDPDPLVEDGPRQVWESLDKLQAHVVYGFPGTTLRSRDRFALELISTILGGQSGRLFLEVRDKRALAYRVSASSVEGIDPGYFSIYVATSPQNLAVAVAAIEDELDKLRKKPVSKEELERARRYLIGAHDILLQRRSALASTIAFDAAYGVGADAYLRYAAELERIGPAELQAVAARYLDRRRAVIATVRPPRDEKAPALARASKPTRPKPRKR